MRRVANPLESLDSGPSGRHTMPMRVRLGGLLFSIVFSTVAAALLAGVAPRVEAGLDSAIRPPGPRSPADAAPRAARNPSGDATAASAGRPRWKRRIDRVVSGRSVGVAVHLDDTVLYKRAATRRRVPASNQKLLASMVLLEAFEPTDRLATVAAAPALAGGVVTGDLWILGRGDPAVTGGGRYRKSLPFRPTGLGTLARRLAAAGVTRITGSVRGGTGYFKHDWWAAGWKDYFPSLYVALPSALTFDGNAADGRHIGDPEWRAARALTKKLRASGIAVKEAPGAGVPPGGLVEAARVESRPLETLLRHMNRASSNFFAEVLGKRAGVIHAGAPGTIAKGAAAIEAYGKSRYVSITAHDSSGLSYANRISARGLARLLDDADEQPWGPALRRTLPTGGQGTLKERLARVRVRAKTGTLVRRSALSGYVWLERRRAWASFSIISNGMAKSKAAAIEDKIVRLLEARAR